MNVFDEIRHSLELLQGAYDASMEMLKLMQHKWDVISNTLDAAGVPATINGKTLPLDERVAILANGRTAVAPEIKANRKEMQL